MRLVVILLLAFIVGAWCFFSPGTLFVVILSAGALYIFGLKFKDPSQKKFVMTVCILALSLRFLLSIFNYYFCYFAGKGADLIPDAGAYSASGQYIAEVITQKPAMNIDNNEVPWLRYLRSQYKGYLPSITAYRVDIFARYVGAIYTFFRYSPVTVKFINSFLSVFTSILLFSLAKRMFSIKIANIVLTLTLFWPSIFLWSVTGIKETLVIFLITLSIFIYLNYLKKHLDILEFGILWLILAIPSYSICILFLIGIFLFRIYKYKKDNLKNKIAERIIIPLLLILVMKTAFSFIALIRMPLFTVLLIIFLLSAISLLKKRTLIFLLISVFLVVFYLLFNHYVDINKYYNQFARSTIDHQYGQWQHIDSGYKIYPDKFYGSKLNISYAEFTLSYLKGLSYVLFSPFLISDIKDIATLFAFMQMILFYLFFPFIVTGIFIALRFKWRDTFLMIIFIFITVSLLALYEGNIGTVFRHRDIAMGFLLLFAGIGLGNSLGYIDRAKLLI